MSPDFNNIEVGAFYEVSIFLNGIFSTKKDA
jgi:hypothetical protein